MKVIAPVIILLASSFRAAFSHPEGNSAADVERAISERSAHHVKAQRSLGDCANSPEAQALRARAAARRAEKTIQLRRERGITEKVISHPKRDQVSLTKWSHISHNRSSTDYSLQTSETTIFTSNATCALVPETIVGPYFVTGEFIRSNVSENQPGIRTHLDIQFVDVHTCKPLPNMIIDLWHANSTGFYSGVLDSGGLNTTFHRGVQVSDADGVVQFSTTFPGHYFGRATHIHVVSQVNGVILPNGTYTGGKAQHIGQLYFDDSLAQAVEKHWPYTTNTMPWTTSTRDFLTQDESTDKYDPYVDYVQLSHDLSDGLMTWITIAVDTKADYSANLQAASHYYREGGVAVPFNCSAFPPMGFPPFNGTFPPFNGTGFGFPPFNGTGLPPFNITGFPPFNGTGFPFPFPFPFPLNGTFPGCNTTSSATTTTTKAPAASHTH